MTTSTLNVGRDFSRYPAGRYKSDGPFPGETFRKRFLAPALKSYDQVIINLDGTAGYGSSFLEEAFGGLVADEEFTESELRTKLQFISKDEPWIPQEIWTYIQKAVESKPQTVTSK